MPNYEEAYAGTSGLRDDFIGTIISAAFVYDAEYDSGNTLIARVEVRDEEDPNGDPIVLKLSTGSGWEDDEKGTKAKREDGKDPKGFNKSCNYYIFTASMAETAYGKVMFKTAPPWDAAIFDGEPKFHFTTVEMAGVEKGTKRNPTVVDEYLGSGGEAKGAGKTAAKAAPAKDAEADETPAQKAKRVAAEKKAAKAAPAEAEEESADMTLLKSIAAEVDTHEEFMERAYGELADADALEANIVDEEWYAANHS